MKDYPALILNADYQPISYFPLSLWNWQASIKAVFLNRVQIISEYDSEVRSSSFSKTKESEEASSLKLGIFKAEIISNPKTTLKTTTGLPEIIEANVWRVFLGIG